MAPPTTSNRLPGDDDTAVVSRRVIRRVEAKNERAGDSAPGAFDFAVEGGTPEDLSLGLMASYLGARAACQSAALDLTVDVERVAVEVERDTTRSDGGTATPDVGDVGPTWSPDAARSSNRVRAVVEARADESPRNLAAWRDRLVDDDVPFSMVPGLVGVDIIVTSLAGRTGHEDAAEE